MNLLCQRPQDELALRDADMRDLQALVVYFLVTVEQNVQIDVSWALVDHL